ncbi:MAG: hypothetical protein NTX03_10180 [Bacteroidetes bacterium]|nr:hypothetical protein [Bacteroidota bacterium]
MEKQQLRSFFLFSFGEGVRRTDEANCSQLSSTTGMIILGNYIIRVTK